VAALVIIQLRPPDKISADPIYQLATAVVLSVLVAAGIYLKLAVRSKESHLRRREPLQIGRRTVSLLVL
jgi:hypothetical protein